MRIVLYILIVALPASAFAKGWTRVSRRCDYELLLQEGLDLANRFREHDGAFRTNGETPSQNGKDVLLNGDPDFVPEFAFDATPTKGVVRPEAVASKKTPTEVDPDTYDYVRYRVGEEERFRRILGNEYVDETTRFMSQHGLAIGRALAAAYARRGTHQWDTGTVEEALHEIGQPHAPAPIRWIIEEALAREVWHPGKTKRILRNPEGFAKNFRSTLSLKMMQELRDSARRQSEERPWKEEEEMRQHMSWAQLNFASPELGARVGIKPRVTMALVEHPEAYKAASDITQRGFTLLAEGEGVRHGLNLKAEANWPKFMAVEESTGKFVFSDLVKQKFSEENIVESLQALEDGIVALEMAKGVRQSLELEISAEPGIDSYYQVNEGGLLTGPRGTPIQVRGYPVRVRWR